MTSLKAESARLKFIERMRRMLLYKYDSVGRRIHGRLKHLSNNRLMKLISRVLELHGVLPNRAAILQAIREDKVITANIGEHNVNRAVSDCVGKRWLRDRPHSYTTRSSQ